MHKRSFGWITIKIYNEIKGLKVPTYDRAILVTYNKEDCQALKLLVDELAKMQYSVDITPTVSYAHQHKRQVSEVGQEVHSQFKEILKFAHFGYDEKKISFRRHPDE